MRVHDRTAAAEAAETSRRDGRQLYYYGRDGKIMAVAIKPGAQFQFDSPKPLFSANLAIVPNASFEVSKDGRFLLPALVEQETAPMTVVLNWLEELKRRVPGGK